MSYHTFHVLTKERGVLSAPSNAPTLNEASQVTQNLSRHFPEREQHVNALCNEFGADFLTTVEAARLEVGHRAAAVKAIEKRWKMSFTKAIPEEFRPGTVGRHFAQAFNKLTKNCAYEEAWGKDSGTGLLQRIIQARIQARSHGARCECLTLKDLQTASSQMKPEESTGTHMHCNCPWSGRSNKITKKSRGRTQPERTAATDEESLTTGVVQSPSAKSQLLGLPGESLAGESPIPAGSTALDAAANDDNGSQGPHKTGDGEVEKSSPGTGLNADCYNSENVALTNMQGLLVGTDIDRRKTTLAADADLNTIDAKGVTTTALQSHDPEYNADSDTVSAVVPSSSDPGTEGPGAAKPGKSAELVEEAVPGPIASNTNLIPHQLKQSAHSKLEAQYQADRLRIIKEANSAAPDERIEISDDTDDISDSEEGDRQDNHEDGTEEDQNRNNTPKIAEKKPTLSLQSPKKSRQTPPIPKSIAHKTLISFLLPDFKDWLFDFHELFNVEIETFIAWCRATPGAYDDALNGTEGLQMLTFSVMQQLLAQDSTFYAIIMSQHARMHNVAWKVISNLLYPTRVPQDLSKQTADGTLDIPPHDRGPVYRATYNHRIKSSGDVWTFPIEYLIQTDLDNNPILPSDTRNELTLSHMMRRMPECQLHTDRTFNKAGDRPIYDPLIRFSPCTAVGEALIGMRGWDDLLVSGELSRIWNQRGTDLVYMRRIMSKTLEGYKACTQFQVPHHRIELSRDMSSSEAEPSPRSSVRLPSESLSVQKAVRASSSKTTIKSPTSPVRDSGDAMDRIAARDPVRQVDDLSTVETNEEGSKTTLDLVTKKMRAGKVPVSASQVPQGRRKGYDDPPLAPGLSRGWRKPPF